MVEKPAIRELGDASFLLDPLPHGVDNPPHTQQLVLSPPDERCCLRQRVPLAKSAAQQQLGAKNF